MEKKVNLKIDEREIAVDEGTTILDAAQQNGIRIPTLCHHPCLSNWGGCRLCVVEVDGSPKLVASCVMPVREGMGVVTSNDRIIEARRTILEFMFAERNHYCMFCAQSGDCELQSLAYEMQMDHLTVPSSHQAFPVDITSEYMAIDHNRCVLCGRCIRGCQEIAGAYVLNFQNRGPHSLIGLDLNEERGESSCYSCGVCMQVCPTGAIYNRYMTHYAVKGHRKDWETIDSFCPQCGLLCPTLHSVRDNNLLKIEGKLSLNGGSPDLGQLCYKGRFEPFKTIGTRLLQPRVRRKDGTWVEETWQNALDLVAEKLGTIRDTYSGKAIFGLASSRCSNEELVLFRDIMSGGWASGYIDTLDGDHMRTISRAREDVGKTFREASWKRILESDFILAVGADPYKSQPLLSSLIHRCVMEKGVKLAIIGTRDFMHPWTSLYLSPENGNKLLLIKALLDEAISSIKESFGEAGEINVPDMLKREGMDWETRKTLYEMVRIFNKSKNPIIIAGEELTAIEDQSWLMYIMKLAFLKGILPENTLRLIILKPDGNSAGAWRLGVSSREGIKGKDKLRGGLILLGGEETLSSDLLDRFSGLDFLGVMSPYFPEALADKAHVIIPKPLWMEEGGTYTSLDGIEFSYREKILNPPEGVKGSWQTMVALADRTKFRPDFKTWKELRKKVEKEMELGPFLMY
ncbi:MAG: molybdopterin-dependent oxidoreductase [Thermodesulfobacteriota bacterium]